MSSLSAIEGAVALPRTVLSIVALLAVSSLGPGCAIGLGTMKALSGDWPTSDSHESKAWVGGEPRRSLSLEAHLSTPPRALCEQHIWEPEAHVTREDWGLSAGARFAIGFIGVGEMALGMLPLLLSDEVDVGAGIALGALALDGLVTIIMAATIPDTHKRREYRQPSAEYRTPECPPQVAFEVRGRVLPVYPDGSITHDDSRFLMESVLSAEPVFGMRNGNDVRRVDVPVEVQCDWATFLNHPAQWRVCPRPPVMVPVPVVPVRPPPIR